MTYDRIEAKPIPGEICRFCSDDSAPLVNTPCCDSWICCGTSDLSSRGGGDSQFANGSDSFCHFHYYHEKHHGRAKDGKECRRFFGEEEFERLAEDRMNTPRDSAGGTFEWQDGACTSARYATWKVIIQAGFTLLREKLSSVFPGSESDQKQSQSATDKWHLIACVIECAFIWENKQLPELRVRAGVRRNATKRRTFPVNLTH